MDDADVVPRLAPVSGRRKGAEDAGPRLVAEATMGPNVVDLHVSPNTSWHRMGRHPAWSGAIWLGAAAWTVAFFWSGAPEWLWIAGFALFFVPTLLRLGPLSGRA